VFVLIPLADATSTLNWIVLLPIVAGGLAVWYMLPSPTRRPLVFGVLAALVALAGFGAFLLNGLGEQVPWSVESVLFYGFSGLTVVFAFLMITGRNPARCALSFAMVILSTCGLFLLLAAPFLMAATIIIYAGAIIVTFLFVIMLSQQSGPSSADLRSREPELATAAGFILLATLLVGLQRVHDWRGVDAAIEHAAQMAGAEQLDRDYLSKLPPDNDGMGTQPIPLSPKAERFIAEMQAALDRVKLGSPRESGDQRIADHRTVIEVTNEIDFLAMSGFKDPHGDGIQASCQKIADGLLRLKALRTGGAAFEGVTLSEHGVVKPIGEGPKQLPAANVSAIGRTLFSDHLLAIELAGTLLLIATIGAIAIAGRRREAAHA
jgi:NADH-quinone oxidoreductase subunit J